MTNSTRPLGEFIREQRKLAHLSLRELARTTRVSSAYLSQVERGLHEPSIRVLSAVADVLQVPMEAMIAGQPTASTDGSTPVHPSVEAAIRLDPVLGAAGKQTLLNVYRGLVSLESQGDPAANVRSREDSSIATAGGDENA